METPDDRAASLFSATRREVHRATDRLFFWLFLVQWVLAVVVALTVDGGSSVQDQVRLAAWFGGWLNAAPLVLILTRSGSRLTRAVVAATQIGWSILLVELFDHRVETHFHLFGSLAFLAFYRDWRVLVLAMWTVAVEHGARAVLVPALTGPVPPENWAHLLEVYGWLGFEGIVLIDSTVRSLREMRQIADRQASFEQLTLSIEDQVLAKTTELEASNQRYRALVEGSHAIPWELDPARLSFIYLSPVAEKLTGFTTDQLTTGRTVSNLIHPDDRHRVKGALLELVAQGEVSEEAQTLDFECRMVTATGATVDVRSRVSLNSATRTLLGLSFDVTRQNKLELELRQAQKLESVGRLAAGVAHEINTPIQFVSDSVHFVRDAAADLGSLFARYRALVGSLDPSDPRRGELEQAERDADVDYVMEQLPGALDRSLEGLQRVATIVRSMKEFAHPDRTEMAPVDINRGIQSTLTIARNEYKYLADLDVSLADLPLVTCHAGDVNQVILNLVVNAAHAIEDVVGTSGERGLITVRTRREGGFVVIEVADTGAGIPDAYRERIFDPFFTTKPVGKGTGQGLAIARAVIADKHGGTIDFRSQMGRGTTFTLRLPIEPIAREAA
ncbi:MAG: ATP-binding protein [Myxococcota bacterium]